MKKITILLVDDTFFMRETLKKYLGEDRFEIIEGKNGIEAVNLYKNHNPHIVSMDITMPDMDGKQALIKIKEIDKTAVVMMSTALGQEEHVKECLLYGCSNYVVKPFSKEVYLQKIEELIKRSVILKKCPFEVGVDCPSCPYTDVCRIEK